MALIPRAGTALALGIFVLSVRKDKLEIVRRVF